jgi:Ca-dependent carbohydrate-binding module xylan-binding/Glycosyl hydrolases family 18
MAITDPTAAPDLGALQQQVDDLTTRLHRGLRVNLAADVYNGNPLCNIDLDGQRLATGYPVMVLHDSGQWQTFAWTDAPVDPGTPHTVAVTFTNDGWDGTSTKSGHDRNLYVGAISLNGVDQGIAPATLMTNGTVTFKVGTQPASPAPAPAPPPAPAPAATGPAPAASTALPADVLLAYYWPFGAHESMQAVMQQAPHYNVLSYVSAVPSGNGNANMVMNGGAEPGLAASIAAWRASGRVALLLVSHQGPGVKINLFSAADVTNFVNSISALIDTYGFQGIDWDLEDSFTASAQSAVVNATALLKAKYGPQFIVSCVPRDYEVRGGAIWAQCMKAMGSNLDLIGLQEYDNAAYADPNFGQIKADFADLIAQGFPASKALLGTASWSGVSVSGGAASPATYASAYTFLKGAYGIRGAFVWQTTSDANDQPSQSYHTALAAAMGL